MLNLERQIEKIIEKEIWECTERIVRNMVRYEAHIWIYNLTDKLGLYVYTIVLNVAFYIHNKGV